MKRRTARKWVIRLGFTIIAFSISAWAVTGLVGPTLASMGQPLRPFATVDPMLRPALPATSMEALDKALPVIKRPGQTIRVRLFADRTLHDLSIAGEKGIQIGQKKMTGTVHVTQDGNRVVMWSSGQQLAEGVKVQIIPLADGLLKISLSKTLSRRTAGQITLTVEKGSLEIVNRLDIDTYAAGTVEPEMGSLGLPIEALKAQIIVSRSYVLALRDRHVHEDYDFCDTAHCLVYGGVGHYSARFQKAATDVKGLVVTFNGHPAATFFHHSSGAATAAIEDIWPGPKIPYLRRVQETPVGRPDAMSQWSFTLSRKSLVKCFSNAGWIAPMEALDRLEVIQTNGSGRALEVLVQSSAPHWIQANHFRQVVNHYFHSELMRSTDFTIKMQGNLITISGHGWGHGVGLSQMGAIHLARHGKTYNEILLHYFPGTKIGNLPAKPVETDPRLKQHLVSWLD